MVEEELVGEREEEGVGDSLGRKGDKEEDGGSKEVEEDKEEEEEEEGVGQGKNSPGCKSDKPLTVQHAANSNLIKRI